MLRAVIFELTVMFTTERTHMIGMQLCNLVALGQRYPKDKLVRAKRVGQAEAGKELQTSSGKLTVDAEDAHVIFSSGRRFLVRRDDDTVFALKDNGPAKRLDL